MNKFVMSMVLVGEEINFVFPWQPASINRPESWLGSWEGLRTSFSVDGRKKHGLWSIQSLVHTF